MAAFPTSTTLPSASSLSYHHLFSHGANHHHHHHHHHQEQQQQQQQQQQHPTSSTTLNSNADDASIINDIQVNGLLESTADFPFSLPSSQPSTLFDVSIPSSHCHNDPLVRHLFSYRPTDSNHAGNYYSNTSTGSFVNAFDYSYATTTTAPSTTETTADTTSTNLSQAQHPYPLNSAYIPYHSQQQQQQQQQPHQHQQQQQQNIYPWMRRIHHGCGESTH
jgi:hypothetical protein